MPRRQPAYLRTRGLCAVVLILVVWLASAASAEKRTYNLDNDPLRLGNKAMEAGRLDEARDHFNEAVANDHRIPDALCGLAAIDLRQGLYADAEARYRQALAGGGNQPTARAGLGLLLLRQGRDQEARDAFDQALQEDAKSWPAHYGLARLELAAENWDAAAEQLEFGRKERGLAEGEDRYQHGRALYLLGTGDLSGAERAALHAQVLNPTDPQYAKLVARIYQDEGHLSLAIAAYEQALNTPGFSASAGLLHELGRLYAQESRFNEASERYLQAVAADSTYAPVVKDLADLYLRAQRFNKAAGTYLRYLALVPEDRQARIDLTDSLVEMGRFDQAALSARQVWRQIPEDAEAAFRFAQIGIHARADSLKTEAAELMTRLLASPEKDQPWQAGDLVDLAAWQADRKDYEGAAANLEQAALLAPEDASIPFQQGLIALSRGQADAGATHFRRAVELDPATPANHLNLGIAQYQAGHLAESIPAFRQAVALKPELTIARILLAQVLASTGSLTEAENEYRGVLTREPENAKALRGIGFCRLRAADYPAAAEAYTRAVAADPANADGWAGLGNSRLGQGDLTAAEAAFDKAAAIDPENIMLKTGKQLLEQAEKTGKENQ